MQNSNDYSNKIRETFLNFFKKNSHSEIESSSLIPNDDSTLLFVNSGMVQFKKWVTGEENPKNKNVVYFSNHTSYMDIFILGSKVNGLFVAKAEINNWPIINMICRLGKTIFINRSKI